MRLVGQRSSVGVRFQIVDELIDGAARPYCNYEMSTTAREVSVFSIFASDRCAMVKS